MALWSFSIFLFYKKNQSPSTKNVNTVRGFKLHVFHRGGGVTESHVWKKQKTTKRARGLSHINDWKKEIGKVSTVFHSADSGDGVFPSLWDSSNGSRGGSSSSCSRGVRCYQVGRGLRFLSVQFCPARSVKEACYHCLPRTSSAAQASHQLDDLFIKHFEPVMHWSSSVSQLRAATTQTLAEDNGR